MDATDAAYAEMGVDREQADTARDWLQNAMIDYMAENGLVYDSSTWSMDCMIARGEATTNHEYRLTRGSLVLAFRYIVAGDRVIYQLPDPLPAPMETE